MFGSEIIANNFKNKNYHTKIQNSRFELLCEILYVLCNFVLRLAGSDAQLNKMEV